MLLFSRIISDKRIYLPEQLSNSQLPFLLLELLFMLLLPATLLPDALLLDDELLLPTLLLEPNALLTLLLAPPLTLFADLPLIL